MPSPSQNAARPIVQLEDVGKTFPNGVEALRKVSLELAAGEFVSLLGPSGCGKSTILRLAAGLLQPSAGAIHRGWQPPAGDSSQQPVGCVFQEPTLMPWARVWENVYLPLRLQGVSRAAARERVDAALSRVGLAEFARAYPRELSGGMKMRSAVARATVTQPLLLMLDEPFAALDEITRFRLNDDLLALWTDQKWSGLFVTHSVYESVFLSSRVLVMSPRPGRVAAEIAIPLPYPRTDATRIDSQYVELCGKVSAALEQAIRVEGVAT